MNGVSTYTSDNGITRTDECKRMIENSIEFRQLQRARNLRKEISVFSGTECSEYDRADALSVRWWKRYDNKCKEIDAIMKRDLAEELEDAEKFEKRYKEYKDNEDE